MPEWDAKTAEWYAEKYGEYPTNRLAIDALPLAADSIVVDVGCGTGSALRHAAAVVTNGMLIGVDPVPRMVEIAKEKSAEHPAAKRLQFLEGPAEALPVQDDFADFVLAFDSFDHWKNQPLGLAEAHRILRPGGMLIVVKDGGTPNAAHAGNAFVEELTPSGFTIALEKKISEGDVQFMMWQCVPAK